MKATPDNDQPMESRYLTVPQVARALSMDESGVYRMCRRQEIPSVRFGKSVRVPRLAFERMLARREGTSTEPGFLTDETSEEPTPPLGEQVKQFEEATQMSPEQWLEEWRSGRIEDNAENSRTAILALALREAASSKAAEKPALALATHIRLGGR